MTTETVRYQALVLAVDARRPHETPEETFIRAHVYLHFLDHHEHKEIVMELAAAADAINTSATSINDSATALAAAVTRIPAAQDTSVLDAPVAALQSASTSLSDAVNALTAALPA